MTDDRYRVEVQGEARVVSAPAGEPMLDALLAAGIDYPHGCTSGVCGLCKSRLVSGRVELAEYCPALNDAERRAGMTLPCCAAPLSDCVIAPVHDGLLPGVRAFEAEVVELTPLTHDIRLLRLAPPPGTRLHYLAGQYASLGFAGLPPRDFSMAGPPGEDMLEFFVRRIPGGPVTNFVFDRVRAGDRVQVKGPYGTAYLREAHLGPILAVAGGSGLAPVRAIVRTALARAMRQEIRLYVGVRAARDLLLREELAALAAAHGNVSVEVAYSASAPDGARAGMLHEVLRQDLAGAALDGWRAYVAGPPAMVDAVGAVLRGLGLRDDCCHVDPFLTAAERARGGLPQRRAS